MSTVSRQALFGFLDETLDIHSFKDYCPNGLQVEGKAEIAKVAFGVTVTQALIDAALAWGADALIAHHGIFWNSDPRSLTGFRRARLKQVLAADLNIGGYHLPLDAHLDYGNNAQLAKLMGLEILGPFPERGGVGVSAKVRDALSAEQWRSRLQEHCGEPITSFLNGPEQIQQVAIVSGRGGSYLEEAISEHQLFITGEPELAMMPIAAEMGVHILCAGHFRTETFGVRRLASLVAEQFGVETKTIELLNRV